MAYEGKGPVVKYKREEYKPKFEFDAILNEINNKNSKLGGLEVKTFRAVD